jgi:4-aminobutyrate aminotransferase / (S)-3-amino-2-methylpropionate transaminase / 5-aminovalerate transaminase
MPMAKGIADGFPLSAFIAWEEIGDSFKPGNHLSTFGGNPVSFAAGSANIEFLEKKELADEALKKGDYLKQQLAPLKSKYNMIGEVRGKGLMVGIELIRDQNKTPANTEGSKIRDFWLGMGLLIGLGGSYCNVLRIQPPLVISLK